MKFSKETLQIIAGINLINAGSPVMGAVFKKGNVIKARRYKSKAPIMIATVDTEFPQDFAIYDLKKFLSLLSMMDEPDVTFESDHILVKSGKKKVKFRYVNESLIEDPTFFTRDIKKQPALFTFNLSDDDFKTIKSAAARLDAPEIAFISSGGTVIMSTYNTKDSRGDKFEIEIGESSDDFTIIVGMESINFLKRDYQVTLSKLGLIEWKSDDLTYYITMSDKSKV